MSMPPPAASPHTCPTPPPTDLQDYSCWGISLSAVKTHQRHCAPSSTPFVTPVSPSQISLLRSAMETPRPLVGHSTPLCVPSSSKAEAGLLVMVRRAAGLVPLRTVVVVVVLPEVRFFSLINVEISFLRAFSL